ncbi:MAG: tyrosine-type recombinase/integrase [Chloroflexia bacterium]
MTKTEHDEGSSSGTGGNVTRGRRGNNEGAIYKRKSDGKWFSSISLGYGPDGKRTRKAFSGETRKEVSEKLKVALRDQQQGLPVAMERQTINQFLTRWLEDSAKQRVRASTYESYEIQVRVHIVPALGRVQLAALTPQQVAAWLKQKRESGLSSRSVQYMHAVLRMALGQALKWGLVARNVATLVEPPRVKRAEIRPWTVAQAKTFLEAVKGDRLEALYSVALALGLRRGEALALRWEDVDLDKRTLTVRASLQRVEHKLQRGEPKTERSMRTLKLPSVTVAALKAHRVRQLESRLLAGDRWQDTGYVFTSTIGTPLEPRNVLRTFQKAVEDAGFPPTKFHNLRHSCISLLVAQGVPLQTVSWLAGHSRLATTADIYTHIMQAQFDDAADRMDDLLNGAG